MLHNPQVNRGIKFILFSALFWMQIGFLLLVFLRHCCSHGFLKLASLTFKKPLSSLSIISFLPPSFQVLDRLVWYLRIVHSIDYYNTCEYPSEDEMPNRCGMIHVRGPIPPNRITHGEGQCVSPVCVTWRSVPSSDNVI